MLPIHPCLTDPPDFPNLFPQVSPLLPQAQIPGFPVLPYFQQLMAPTSNLAVQMAQIQLLLANNPFLAYQQACLQQLNMTSPSSLLTGSSLAPLPSPTLAPVPPPVIPSVVAPDTAYQYFLMKRTEAKKAGDPVDPRSYYEVWQLMSKAEKDEYGELAKKHRELLEKLELKGKIMIGSSPIRCKRVREKMASSPLNLEQVWLRDIQNQMAKTSGFPQVTFVTSTYNFLRRAWRMAKRQGVSMDGYPRKPNDAWNTMSENERDLVEMQYRKVKGKLQKLEMEGRISLDWSITAVQEKRIKEKKMREVE